MAVPPPTKPVIPPVFAPQLHNEAMQALSVLLMQAEMLPAVGAAEVEPLTRCIDAMADAVIDAHGQRYEASEPVPVRDYYYAHPVKVAELAILLAKLAGGGRAQLRTAGLAAMLMNAGYVRLRPGTIDGAGPLGDAERAHMQEHPRAGHEMLGDAGLPADALAAIVQHHERWDGSGYPEGRSEKQISLYARLVGAADVYVALCSPRPHRPAHTRHHVDEFFMVESGALFDPAIARLLIEELPRHYEHVEAVTH